MAGELTRPPAAESEGSSRTRGRGSPRPEVEEGAALSRSGERHRGGVLGRLLTPFFAQVSLEPEAIERLKDAYTQGTVVHVFRARRVMDPIFLLYALERLGLPKPLWMHDHHTSKLPPTIAAMSSTLLAGRPALLFLRRPRTLTNPTSGYSERHVETLVALQRQMERPLLLLPETLLWTKRAVGLRRTIIDSIFGDRESPGRLRELMGFFWQYQTARYHVGVPVNIRAVLEREQGQSDRVIAKKIRWSILHHLSREEQLRTGPIYRTAARTRQMVLNDHDVRKFFATRTAHGEPLEALEKKANEMLKTIAADMRYGWLRVLDVFIDIIWNRIYDGIVVDSQGLGLVRTAARRGPVVLVPSHKSHVDYMVLSQVFFKEGLMPPHVAAGDNLNFPPIGTIFRRGGAFFLRRSFKGDKLYATVFSAYVRRLLKEGHALEFFIEGGRSRTGKLLAPKMGMLSMCVDPVIDGSIQDVSFIPVSIGYEKIIEARSYAHELAGGKKKKEDVGTLLSTTKVLRSRYGRVYVDFDEPISLRVFAASRAIEIKAKPEIHGGGSDDSGVESNAITRSLVNQLGHRIVYGINRVTRATPTSVAALVMLSRARRGMAEEELYARADRFIGFLTELGARLSATLEPETRRAAIREAIGRLAADGLVLMVPSPDGETIIRVEDEGRRALDYYKNNVLHFFVPYAIVAMAILSSGPMAAPIESVRAQARWISRLLKLEFSFRVDQDFDANFRTTAERLCARRAIEKRAMEEVSIDLPGGGEALAITKNGRLEVIELAGMLANLLEGYRAVLDCAKELEGEPLQERKFAARALQKAKKQALEGRILRSEAASQSLIETAIARFIEEEILARDAAGQLVVKDEPARVHMVAEISGCLQPLLAED
jgi:glycerol-3-phosphate O-acyltransferase